MRRNDGFKEYCKVWLRDVNEGNPSTLELGRRFARKLVTQWLDIDEYSDDIIYCDGSKDGGIDVAYLEKGDTSDEDSKKNGDTWYVVQSKYTKSLGKGTNIFFNEAIKFFETLSGNREKLSSLSENVIERLKNFLSQASKNDKLIYVFATKDPFDEKERRILAHIRAVGRKEFGEIFDVDAISIETIYERTLESSTTKVEIIVKGEFIESERLLVGTTTLENLYYFLENYYFKTGDLDKLYEKNVRLFLKMYGNVNKNMKKTLEECPENFGLYNNGITIVVDNIEKSSNQSFKLKNPYIVNGCQTTSVIYQVLFNKLRAGGTGKSDVIEEWKEKLSKGIVITKIVKTDQKNRKLLTDITRYTNSQNRVREKDFLALDSGFKIWQTEMKNFYKIFLEIQRGSWESQKAKQQRRKSVFKFENYANIFDLLRVYGAGWFGEAGRARNAGTHFLPGGRIYKKIMTPENFEEFGHIDLYASFSLKEISKKYKFGRSAKDSRRKTEYLFYMVIVELLKFIMLKAEIENSRSNITQSILKLSKNQVAYELLFESSINFIDQYIDPDEEDSVFKEPDYFDLDTYLKNDKVGKNEEYSPKFLNLLKIQKKVMQRSSGGQSSPFEIILAAIKNN